VSDLLAQERFPEDMSSGKNCDFASYGRFAFVLARPLSISRNFQRGDLFFSFMTNSDVWIQFGCRRKANNARHRRWLRLVFPKWSPDGRHLAMLSTCTQADILLSGQLSKIFA
jgi:hypothetical protein